MDTIISGAQQAGMTPEKIEAQRQQKIVEANQQMAQGIDRSSEQQKLASDVRTSQQQADQQKVSSAQPGAMLAQLKVDAQNLFANTTPEQQQAIKDEFAQGVKADTPPPGEQLAKPTQEIREMGDVEEEVMGSKTDFTKRKEADEAGKKKLDSEAEKISKEVKAKTAMQKATKKAQKEGGERVARKERDKAIASKVKAKADKKQATLDELASGVQKAKAMKIEAGDIESDKPIGEALAEGPSTEKTKVEKLKADFAKKHQPGGEHYVEPSKEEAKKITEVSAKVGDKDLAVTLTADKTESSKALVKAIDKVPGKEKSKVGKALSKVYDVMDKSLRDPRVTAALLGAAKGIDPKGFGGGIADAAMPWVQEQIKVNAADIYGKKQGKIYNDYISHVLSGKDPATFKGNMTPANISKATDDAMKVATFGLAVNTSPTVTQQLMSKLIVADKNNDAAYQRTLMTVMGQMTASRNKMQNATDTKELSEHYKVIGKITSAIEPAQMNLLFGEIKRSDYADDDKFNAAKAAKEDQMISFLQGEKGSVITPQMKAGAVNAYDFLTSKGLNPILDARVISKWRSEDQKNYGVKASSVTDEASFKVWADSAGITFTEEGTGADKVYVATDGTKYTIKDGKLQKAK